MRETKDRSLFTFKIHEETIDNIDDIDLDDLTTHDINILHLQAGVGKTTAAFKFMEKNSKTFYGTNRHDVIEEHIENFDLRGFTHWYGLKWICKNKLNKYLNDELKVPSKFLCPKCPLKSDCPYIPQFRKRTKIVAPLNFIQTKYVLKDKGVRSKFDYFIIDEDFSEKFDTYRAPPKGFNAYVWEVKMDEALEHKDLKTVRKLMRYTESEQQNYYKWKYNDLNPVSVQYLYYIFEFCLNYNKPIILLDATFHKDRFLWFLKRYKRLYKRGFYNPSIQIKKTNIINKDTTVYVLPPHFSSYYRADIKAKKSSLLADATENRNKISAMIGDDIPIITYKDSAPKGALYFNGLTSSNLYEDAKWIDILGTPIVNPLEFEEIFSYQFFGEHIPSCEVENKEWLKTHGHDSRGIKRSYVDYYVSGSGEKLPIKFISYIFEDQLLQAFYRTRGLQNKRFILRHGDVPDEIKRVFNVVYVNDKRKLFKQLRRKYSKKKMELIEHAAFVRTASLRNIAFVFRLYKDSHYHYDLVAAKELRKELIKKTTSITDREIREYQNEILLDYRERYKNTPIEELAEMMHISSRQAKKVRERI